MVAYASAQLVQECPDEELLLQFDRGQLSELDSSSISLHLSSCDRCMETLGELQSEGEDDPILACLKQCLRDPLPPVSPKYAEMEARAKALEYEEKIRRASVWDLGAGVDGNSVIGLRIGPYEVLGQGRPGGDGDRLPGVAAALATHGRHQDDPGGPSRECFHGRPILARRQSGRAVAASQRGAGV